MTAVAMQGFAPRPAADRNAFLVLVGLVWVGVISGFGTDSFDHVSKHGLDYPLIVHVHALAMVSWLVLFTTQVALIQIGRPDLHRRLGMAALGLAALMIVLGPAAALTTDAARYAATGKTPEFLAVQLLDIVAFTTLTGAGVLLRGSPAAHKRLMMLGLIYISNAGFARFLNGFAAEPLGDGFWGGMVGTFLGGDLLALGLGAYDLVTRGRLHPAYVVGVSWMLALELTARTLLHNPAWKALTLRLIGH
jgi:hypothetical protein